MKRPGRSEITWSLMHPVSLNTNYMKEVIRRAEQYRVDSFEICGECHNPYGGLDGLITYAEYPSVAGAIDPERIEHNRRSLRAIVEMAHQQDRPVYYWHREIMIPPGLVQVIPELLDENREFDLLGDAFARLVTLKIEEALKAVPELDGLVLTLTEADYSVIHNSTPDRYPPGKVVAHMARTFCKALAARGKRFILRSFGSIAQDYEDILAGAAEAANDYPFEIETKITPYDFSPFLPPNPFLRNMPGTTMSAECDCQGEFLGAGYLPAANVERIVEYVREAQSKRVDRFTLRLDRIANNIFDSAYEVNLLAYQRAIDDPEATATTIWQEWADKNWPSCPGAMTALTAQGIQAVHKINFIQGNLMFHMFPLDPSLKWVKAGGIFSLFKQGVPLEWQNGIWSILSQHTAPQSRQLILREKEEAIRIATEQLRKLEELRTRLSADQYRRAHQEWDTALQVARLYRAFCQCVCAYFDDMEGDRNKPVSLEQAIEETALLFAQYLSPAEMNAREAGAPLSDAIEHHAMTPRADPLKNVYAAPLWAIVNELCNEYAAEYESRNTWKKKAGVSDLILFGALTDEWRIRRYMHASHSLLHNRRPSRVVANRLFPNGYLEFSLKAPRGGKARLVLEANPASARSIRITVNAQTLTVPMGSGTIELPVETEGRDSLLIRLEKDGASYPQVYLMAAVAMEERA